MPAYLQIDGPDQWAYQVALDDGATFHLGRHPKNNIVLADPSVSSRHAILFQQGNGWRIQDNRSRNGTFVNGVQVGEAVLKHGDVFQIGQTEITFRAVEETSDDDRRAREARHFHRQEQVLRGALDDVGPGQAVAIPAPVPLAVTGPLIPPPDRQPHPATFAPPGSSSIPGVMPNLEQTMLPPTREDMNWVAGQVAEILADLASMRGWSRRAMYERILQRLRATIAAENGFLMIADRDDNRWVIRAWVGDPTEWTSYEKKHPVPITVANQAFKEDRVISNALGARGDNEPQSDSLVMLNVRCYIAVPLHRAGVKEGLLYFDTRRTFKNFASRDVKLLDRIGAYILQVENQA